MAVNWGDVGAWAGAMLSLGSAIGYAVAHDYRKAEQAEFGAL